MKGKQIAKRSTRNGNIELNVSISGKEVKNMSKNKLMEKWQKQREEERKRRWYCGIT